MNRERVLEVTEPSSMAQILFAIQITIGMAAALLAEPLGLPPEVAPLAAVIWCSAGLAWLLESRLAPHSRWLPILALGVAIYSASGQFERPEILSLLVIPTVEAVVILGTVQATAAAVIATTLLLPSLALRMGDGDDTTVWAVPLIAIWSTLGLALAVSSRFQRLVDWSWEQYAYSRDLLEESRKQRAELKQSLADTADVGRQLVLANEKLAVARRAAEEAESAKSIFVANVSHELRTPLNLIVGFSDMITQSPEAYGGAIPATLLADLVVVLRNAQHLSGLIDDVLDLSQIEAKQMAVVKERVDMREIIEAVKVAVARLFASRNLYLETEVPDNLPRVLCDRSRIREVVLNLLSNAAHFTERGGVRVRVWNQGDTVITSVADTGPGISPTDAERLFRPFEQLDGSTRRRVGGSGLGLSIAKAFVELHGGKIWVESQKGAGATFCFQLPIDSPAPMTSSPTRWLSEDWPYKQRTRPSLAKPFDSRPRVVIQESGQSLRKMANRYLDNVEIVSVKTSEQALAEVTNSPTRMLMINDASHTCVPLGLASNATWPPGLPVLMCALSGVAEAADSLGVADYLLKPLSRSQLLAALDRTHPRARTILIVDDEIESVRLLRRMLASMGRDYRILTAADGEAALAIMRQSRPDVVLLDLVMAGMDGFRFLELKNQDAALSSVPVIIISARDPTGHSIVSDRLVVTRAGGIAIHQILACIDAIGQILTPEGQIGDPRPPENPLGLPACG